MQITLITLGSVPLIYDFTPGASEVITLIILIALIALIALMTLITLIIVIRCSERVCLGLYKTIITRITLVIMSQTL